MSLLYCHRFLQVFFFLFSSADCSFLLNCARFFEKLIVNWRISYFKISDFVWLQNWVWEFNCLTFWMCFVLFCMRYLFETKELLNFHRPEPFLTFLKCWKEQKRAEWSVDMAHKIFESLTTSWKLCEIKIKSSLHWIRPKKCCCLKVL